MTAVGAKLTNAESGPDALLTGANLMNADLTSAKVNNADLSGANLSWADFTSASGTPVTTITTLWLFATCPSGALYAPWAPCW